VRANRSNRKANRSNRKANRTNRTNRQTNRLNRQTNRVIDQAEQDSRALLLALDDFKATCAGQSPQSYVELLDALVKNSLQAPSVAPSDAAQSGDAQYDVVQSDAAPSDADRRAADQQRDVPVEAMVTFPELFAPDREPRDSTRRFIHSSQHS